MAVGAIKMARAKKAVQQTDDGSDRVSIIHMKGSPEYVEWVDKIHRATHIPKVQLFRLALAEWAVKNGHPLPPEI